MSIKRICLFAGYNGDNVIGKDVLFYLKELGRFADVYYFSDGALAPKEREKLKNIVAGAWGELRILGRIDKAARMGKDKFLRRAAFGQRFLFGQRISLR